MCIHVYTFQKFVYDWNQELTGQLVKLSQNEWEFCNAEHRMISNRRVKMATQQKVWSFRGAKLFLLPVGEFQCERTSALFLDAVTYPIFTLVIFSFGCVSNIYDSCDSISNIYPGHFQLQLHLRDLPQSFLVATTPPIF